MTPLEEKVLTEIIESFYREGERRGLDRGLVKDAVEDVVYMFRKDPKKKDKECMICRKKKS